MNTLFIILAFFVIATTDCHKNKSEGDCTSVTITNAAPGCNGWGIILNGTKYPSNNIPLTFQQNNIVVCATYELYEDMRMCPCCGGTWANIKSMK